MDLAATSTLKTLASTPFATSDASAAGASHTPTRRSEGPAKGELDAGPSDRKESSALTVSPEPRRSGKRGAGDALRGRLGVPPLENRRGVGET